jgi:hypothetical protein
VTLARTKNGHQRHVPIPQSIVKTLKALPSHGSHEYLFPSRPTARCPEPQRPYRWDFGKQFRALAKAAGIQNVRSHDLRRAGATILMTLGVPDLVRKVTGHRSRELERYQHLTPELRALTVNLIATELFRGKRTRKERESGTPTGTVRGRRVTEKLEGRQRAGTKRDIGGVAGTRTRGLRRDRPTPAARTIAAKLCYYLFLNSLVRPVTSVIHRLRPVPSCASDTRSDTSLFGLRQRSRDDVHRGLAKLWHQVLVAPRFSRAVSGDLLHKDKSPAKSAGLLSLI